jgi:hypothetical protein
MRGKSASSNTGYGARIPPWIADLVVIVLAGAVSTLAKRKVNEMDYSNGAKLTPSMKQVARNASGVAPDLPPKQSGMKIKRTGDSGR